MAFHRNSFITVVALLCLLAFADCQYGGCDVEGGDVTSLVQVRQSVTFGSGRPEADVFEQVVTEANDQMKRINGMFAAEADKQVQHFGEDLFEEGSEMMPSSPKATEHAVENKVALHASGSHNSEQGVKKDDPNGQKKKDAKEIAAVKATAKKKEEAEKLVEKREEDMQELSKKKLEAEKKAREAAREVAKTEEALRRAAALEKKEKERAAAQRRAFAERKEADLRATAAKEAAETAESHLALLKTTAAHKAQDSMMAFDHAKKSAKMWEEAQQRVDDAKKVTHEKEAIKETAYEVAAKANKKAEAFMTSVSESQTNQVWPPLQKGQKKEMQKVMGKIAGAAEKVLKSLFPSAHGAPPHMASPEMAHPHGAPPHMAHMVPAAMGHPTIAMPPPAGTTWSQRR